MCTCLAQINEICLITDLQVFIKWRRTVNKQEIILTFSPLLSYYNVLIVTINMNFIANIQRYRAKICLLINKEKCKICQPRRRKYYYIPTYICDR